MTYIFPNVDKKFFHVKGTKTAQQVIDSVTGRNSQSDTPLAKTAISTSMTGGASFAGSQIMYSSPSFYSPLHTAINWQIPTKRREVYLWKNTENTELMKDDFSFVKFKDFNYIPTEITKDSLTNGIVYENIKSEMIFGGVGELRSPINLFECPSKNNDIYYKIKTNGYYRNIEPHEKHCVYIIKGKELRRKVKNYGCKLYREGFRGNTDKKDFIQKTEWNIERIESQDISIGDFLLTPIPQNEVSLPEIHNDIFYLIGVVIADGSLFSTGTSSKVDINCSSEHNNVIEFLHKIGSDHYTRAVSHTHTNSDKCDRVTISTNQCYNDVAKFITGKLNTKRFTKEIRKLSKEQMLHILGGYFDGDGSFTPQNKLVANNISKDMVDQLYFMLLMCGISVSVGKYKRPEQPEGFGIQSTEDYYRLFIPASEIHKLRPYMKSDKIPENFEYDGYDRVLGFFTKDKDGVEYFARSVQSIEEFEYSGIGYDIQIDPERSYVCSGFKVSNCRFFSDNEPTVKAALRFYKEFPFHGYENVINDPIRKEHYDNLKENLNIDKILPMVAYEYFTMGDAFPFVSVNCKKCNGFGTNEQGEICDHEGGSISGITCLNPDWIDVQLNPLLPMDPVINLVPDDSLRQIILSKKPIEIYEKIPQHLRKKILQNQPILLSPRSVSHLKHDEVPYIGYGRSIIAPLFPILAYQDKLRQAQWIVADRHILPIKICKVGNDQRPASSADIRDTQNQLAQTANDPNLTLVTHHAFDFSWEGSCYTENTEVMTKRGFLKYSEVTKKDKIATYNPNTKMLEYHPYIEKFEYDYNSDVDGKIKKFNGKYYDVEVTSNHKMYAKMRKWDQDKYIHTNYQLIEAEKIIENSKFLGHIKWGGKIPKILPYKKIDILKDIDFDSFLKFVGF
ncbi:MAG TPA: LAGLIDADG family homing endonuclease, partial [Candidatus Paceibacterota bacterium]|nr:LAGLIDADG family homing endonuclease [Candidatus Paceibacterota bacterium]